MLSDQQVQSYRENGYLAVPDVLSAAEVAELQRVTDELVEASRMVEAHTDVYDLEPSHSAAEPRVRRIKSPDLQHEAYARTLRHPTILDIVEQLIGPGVRYQSTKLNMKAAGYGSPVEWHQDWGFYPHTNDDILAVGVCIDGMSQENGGMLVVPGSHRGPVYDHHQNGYFVGAVTDSVVDLDQVVQLEVPPGGISLHHVRTLHGSVPNRSPRPRRLLLLEMCAIDAWPLMNMPGLEAFDARILRGSPTVTPRMKAAPVRIPLPTHERRGSIYEVQSKLARPLLAGAR
jgi:ectoine hydroxylase-related dioxygenase (phytanoyl-CoA dioxygenase family)